MNTLSALLVALISCNITSILFNCTLKASIRTSAVSIKFRCSAAKIATALKVPVEAIKTLVMRLLLILSQAPLTTRDCLIIAVFNPIDKIVELYERMLKDRSEMIEKLEGLLKDRK